MDNKHFRIECKDIVLIEFRAEDFEEMQRLTWQPEIYEFLPDWNVAPEQRQEWLINYEIPENQRFLESVANGGRIGDLRLRLGIILKETGEFIGWCCTGPKDELPEPNREIMYAISKDYRGKGYTTQAALGLIRYLFENTEVEMLNALALIENLPSNKVILKSGFKQIDDIIIDEEQYHLYKLHKSDWVSRLQGKEVSLA